MVVPRSDNSALDDVDPELLDELADNADLDASRIDLSAGMT
jgi:hypothetical protein